MMPLPPSNGDQQRKMNPFGPLPFNSATLKKVIENDDRLHKEIDEFMGTYSVLIDEKEDDDEIDLYTFDYSAFMGNGKKH